MKYLYILLLIIVLFAGCSFQSITVNGTVYNDLNSNNTFDVGEGLGGVIITSGSKSVTSSGTGTFSLTGAVSGPNTGIIVYGEKDGFQPGSVNVTVGADDAGNPLAPAQEEVILLLKTP